LKDRIKQHSSRVSFNPKIIKARTPYVKDNPNDLQVVASKHSENDKKSCVDETLASLFFLSP